MGKGARNRRRRQLQATTRPVQPVGSWNVVGGSPKEREQKLIDVLQDVEIPCRTTTSSDPMFGGRGATITELLPGGTVLTDPYEAVPVLPVALFEPPQLLALKDLRTSTFHEPRIEGIISAGFHRQPRGLLANLPAEGWDLHRTKSGLMLRDPFGGIWANSIVSPGSRWLELAAVHSWVTVYYGPCLVLQGQIHQRPAVMPPSGSTDRGHDQVLPARLDPTRPVVLGVRLPPGKPSRTYTLQDRIAEFRRGREQGLCAAASVRWHPEVFDQTMDWVLLPSGALGQPYSVAYVPLWNFDHLGGPATFGLEPVTLRADILGPVPMAQGLAVDITSTDVDFFQPRLDTAVNFVTGYRVPGGAPDPFFADWRRTALQAGAVLLIAGNKDLPAGPTLINDNPADVVARVEDALRHSQAALVPVGVPRHATLT